MLRISAISWDGGGQCHELVKMLNLHFGVPLLLSPTGKLLLGVEEVVPVSSRDRKGKDV